ncbi:hypothetical protein RSOLAG22IIIB_11041 [Rhizoctonia solani]|uniref:Uncharacterized protein n=1 Tax=Rhizoctonia solani TaxID=456999 RepID=A0A0K6G6F0_9AGAM|nr:hypothetical protein RSOLAG22IIIB_11041 [Rhizoctonia solani]
MLAADTSILATPATSARDEELPSRADDKEKVDTFRVVDFAVVYLSRSLNSERIRKQVFALHEFGQYYTPILAEGKRPPQQDNLDAGMMIRLEVLLKLAQRDITEKKHNFFESFGFKFRTPPPEIFEQLVQAPEQLYRDLWPPALILPVPISVSSPGTLNIPDRQTTHAGYPTIPHQH